MQMVYIIRTRTPHIVITNIVIAALAAEKAHRKAQPPSHRHNSNRNRCWRARSFTKINHASMSGDDGSAGQWQHEKKKQQAQQSHVRHAMRMLHWLAYVCSPCTCVTNGYFRNKTDQTFRICVAEFCAPRVSVEWSVESGPNINYERNSSRHVTWFSVRHAEAVQFIAIV